MAFTSLCEAVVSWQAIRHEGLLAKIIRIMQMYKAKLVRRPAFVTSHLTQAVCPGLNRPRCRAALMPQQLPAAVLCIMSIPAPSST